MSQPVVFSISAPKQRGGQPGPNKTLITIIIIRIPVFLTVISIQFNASDIGRGPAVADLLRRQVLGSGSGEKKMRVTGKDPLRFSDGDEGVFGCGEEGG